MRLRRTAAVRDSARLRRRSNARRRHYSVQCQLTPRVVITGVRAVRSSYDFRVFHDNVCKNQSLRSGGTRSIEPHWIYILFNRLFVYYVCVCVCACKRSEKP